MTMMVQDGILLEEADVVMAATAEDLLILLRSCQV